MRIAVLGGGHGSHAAAADLSERGHEVRMWRRDVDAFAPVLAAQRVTLADFRGRREVALALATADIGQALRGAELIVVPTPAFSQVDIAHALAPHLVDGQVVLLPPGSFGSFVMARVVRDAGNRARVAFAETGTLPYLARKHGPAEVAITTRATRLPTGVFPAADSARALALAAQAYPSIEAVEDALSGALMNAGPIIHPPLIVMNAGPLEHCEKCDIHNEGTQPSMRRVTDALDAERIALREALGYARRTSRCADHYNSEADGCTARARQADRQRRLARACRAEDAPLHARGRPATAWPSWSRSATGPACRARSHARCCRSAARSRARTSRWARVHWRRLGSA